MNIRASSLLFALLLSGACSQAAAAIIGPTLDWQPISKLSAEQGISEEMVADILAAGLTLGCRGTDEDNGLTTNAWLMGLNGNAITVAHSFYDEQRRPRAPLDECYAQSLADIADDPSDAFPLETAILDPATLKVGTTDPLNPEIDSQKNRAVFRLATTLKRARPLERPSELTLRVGQEIFVVSRKPMALRQSYLDTEPLMLRTTISRVIQQWEGLPGGIFTDVDDVPGMSGALYLVRDPDDASRLVPVALGIRPRELKNERGEVLDNLPWAAFKNSAVALLLDEYFYSFPEQQPPP